MDGFSTARLMVRDLRAVLVDGRARAELEARLAALLSARVLEHLPPSLGLEGGPDAVAAWIDARVAESDAYVVELAETGALAGLLILAREPGAAAVPQVQIGYLLGEAFWGRGLASELVAGLVAAVVGPVRLLAGVDRNNPASARVLEKAGFAVDAALSTEGVEVFVREVGGDTGLSVPS